MSAVTSPVALELADGPRLTSVLGAYLRRDAAIAVSYRLPFFLGIVQSAISLGFIYFIGRLVGPRITLADTHATYFDFAVVGTVLLTLFNTSLISMAQQLRNDQTTGTLEVLFSMPLRPAIAAIGSIAYQILFAAVTGVATLFIAIGLGLRFHVTVLSALVALCAFFCTVGLFVAVGIAFAGYVLVFKRGETLTGLAVGVLALLGGVYYPVRLLPGTLRALADAVPFTWALSVIRAGLLDGNISAARLVELAMATAVAVPLALATFIVAVRYAKRRGSLGQY